MKLLYTVSSGYLQEQVNFINSLGGYPSSTPVPNDVFNNLFDELSLSEIREGKIQYRAIVLQNDTNKKATDVMLWFDQEETNVCNFKIGATVLSSDGETQFMESVPTSYSKPFQTELYPADINNKVTVGDMEPGQMIGLWISREVDKIKAVAEYNLVAERDLETQTRYKPIEKEKKEAVNFQITWEESEVI